MTSKKLKTKKAVKIFVLPVLTLVSVTVFGLATKNKFDAPGGPYKIIGTHGIELTDENRPEYLSKDPHDNRRLLVQFWYPAENNEELQKAAYHSHPDKFNEDIKTIYALPGMLISRISKSKTEAYTNAQLLKNEPSYPVLIFSHGLNGSRFQNTFQFTELASHGYIVVSIEHPYAASGTVFRDGSIGGTQCFQKMQQKAFSDSLVHTWSNDQIFVMNYLEKINSDPTNIFYDKLDLQKIGIFGHSFGGATTAATLSRDPRPVAGINMDGFYFGDFYKVGFNKPFLELRSEVIPTDLMTDKMLKEWKMSREYYQFIFFDGWKERISSYAKGGYQTITIEGSDHMSFSDFPLIIPFKWLFGKDVARIHRETNKLTLEFFKRHLN